MRKYGNGEVWRPARGLDHSILDPQCSTELLFSVAVSCRTGCAVATQLKDPACR